MNHNDTNSQKNSESDELEVDEKEGYVMIKSKKSPDGLLKVDPKKVTKKQTIAHEYYLEHQLKVPLLILFGAILPDPDKTLF